MDNNIRIEHLLEETVKKKASDLHIQVGIQPVLRVDGALTKITNAPVLD